MRARKLKGNKDFTGIQRDGSKFAAHKSSFIHILIIQKQEGKLKLRHNGGGSVGGLEG